ncbi:MAG: hypothetical protein IPK73_05395 [Candidatus Obscuribacter sp.]|nr:hypothetical protein [Candidatus Obscuribacter sp.]MBK9279032.1 hypothetical protein [Candidatus Obscuribacter sp.]
MENEKASEHAQPLRADEQAADLSRQALTLYECGPGGPIVTNPADCKDYRASNILPELNLSAS